MDRLAPGSRANSIDSLDTDLVLCPLFQVLDGELPLQPVHDYMEENSSFGSRLAVLDAIADVIWVAVVLPLWKWLRGVFTPKSITIVL